MRFDLSTQQGRKKLVDHIESQENKNRKARSLRQWEIFNKNQRQYVLEYLRGNYSEKSVKEIPVISSINLCNRIVKEEASIYSNEPSREFMNLGKNDEAAEELKKKILKLYKDTSVNSKMKSLNRYFKLQNQCHLNWTIRNKKLKARILVGHHLDVIPTVEDPEVGEIYVISSFDKSQYLVNDKSTATGYAPRSEATQSEVVKSNENDEHKVYIVWTAADNFVMDRNGNYKSDGDHKNPIAPVVPFVEVSNEKDFEYWIRATSDSAEFSIQFNGMMSDLQNVVKMQGYGQAVFTGPPEAMPEEFVIGMNSVIRLPVDPSAINQPKFEFVSASPDIVGSLQVLTTALYTFLSSAGIDVSTVVMDGSAQGYASGLERLLAMIQEFEASKDDFDTFEKAEAESFAIIKAYVNAYGGTDKLEVDIADIPEDANMSVTFSEPQAIKTDKEELENMATRKSMGLTSRVRQYMEYYKVSEEEAVKQLKLIDEEDEGPEEPQETDPVADQTQSKDEKQIAEEVTDGRDTGANSQ